MKTNRLQQILKVLEAEGSTRVTYLSQHLQVSESTIRRDLDALYRMGRIQRVHGGALLGEKNSFEPPVNKRIKRNPKEKQAIGKAAASLIRDGDTVFIGSGTTTLEVARNLLDRQELTVITNAMTIANLLAKAEKISLVSIGGFLRHSELSFIGHIAEQALRELRVDKTVIGIPAININDGLTNDYIPEVMTDRAIMEMGSEVILVADHSKFGKVSTAYLAPLNRVSIIITDDKTDPYILSSIRDQGVKVIVTT